ncbi:MAG: osmoprotectant transport system substrate-binding protein opuBD [Thermoleophilaceae bacterium]|jgi:glycine betaine/choline ABC-type transport system substrate-binding protein|nr:osmoprotectant transport system substrate-binding protein opuBD [Thermoleophilaceae bacterium]
MRKSIRAVLAALMVLALTVAIAACGSSSNSSSSSSGGGGGSSSTTPAGGGKVIKKNPANASKTVTVGSKNFPEQFVLGEIYSQALQAAGYKVKKQLNLGSEVIAFKALKQGNIDGYPEYTGTALTSFYKVPVTKVPKDATAAYNELQTKLAGDKIVGLAQTPFENTYQLGMTKKTAAKLGNPTKISDLTGKSKGLIINGYPECAQRPDCLLGVEKTYGLKFKKFVASGDPYPVLDKGAADVAFVFTTDAALTTNKYATLTDDKHLFPPYHITFLIHKSKLQSLGPDAKKVIEMVQTPLTNEVQRELNSRVVLDKKTPKEVASEYLKEAGFVK